STPCTESYLRRCARVAASVMSLTATNSSPFSARQARKTLRPIRPKPLMPTRIVATSEPSPLGEKIRIPFRPVRVKINDVRHLTVQGASGSVAAGGGGGAAGTAHLKHDRRNVGVRDRAGGAPRGAVGRAGDRAPGHGPRHDVGLGAGGAPRPAAPGRLLGR